MQQQNSLRELQLELKKQYLLIERQHRQKAKIKKAIEQSLQTYYTILIEKQKMSTLLKNDKLENTYNYVKDLFLSLSKDERYGLELILKSDEESVKQLAELCLGTLYNSFTQSDEYHKKIITFTKLLSQKFVEEFHKITVNDESKISYKMLPHNFIVIFNQIMKQDDIIEYFMMLGNKVLNQIPLFEGASLTKRWSVIQLHQCSPEIGPKHSISVESFNDSIISSQIEIEAKIEGIIEQFITDITNKADVLPLPLKVLFHFLKKTLNFNSQTKSRILWQILSPQYLKALAPDTTKKQWNHLSNPTFCQYLQKIVLEISEKLKNPEISEKVIEKSSRIQPQKLVGIQPLQKISIHGGCVSYRQLYMLFRTIKENQEYLRPLNDRIANRINKIADVSPNFQMFLQFPNPTTSYIIFIQINYGKLLEKDYFKLYNEHYKNDMVRNMVKQILTSSDFQIIQDIEKGIKLKAILLKNIEKGDKATDRISQGAFAHSSQFLMKMKYLINLFQRENINEDVLVEELLEASIQKQKQYLDIFQKSKLYLLESLTTVENAKKSIITKFQKNATTQQNLKLIKILDQMEVSLCITSPSTRPEDFKYVNSYGNKILIENAASCCHQQNIVQGLNVHSSNIVQTITLFCELKETRQTLNSGKDIFGLYQAFNQFIEKLKQKFREEHLTSFGAYNYFETSIYKILFRVLHEKLLQSKQAYNKDLEFESKTKKLGFIGSQKLIIPPYKYNFEQLQQTWDIACRYFKNFMQMKKTPQSKIDLIKEVIDIIKMSLNKIAISSKISNQAIEIMLAYIFIRAKLKKLVSTVNYIEIFLSKDLLLKKQGMILERVKNAIKLVITQQIRKYVNMKQDQYIEKIEKSTTQTYIEDMKADQKKISSIIYL